MSADGEGRPFDDGAPEVDVPDECQEVDPVLGAPGALRGDDDTLDQLDDLGIGFGGKPST